MRMLFRKKGFTLTETVVGLAVFMLLAGAAASIVLVGFKIYGRSTLRNSAAIVGNEIYELIENRLTYCTDLIVSFKSEDFEDSYPEQEYVCIYVPAEGNYVGMENRTAFPREFISKKQLEGMSAEVKISADIFVDSLVDITVSVYETNGGSRLFTTSGTVELLNAANPNVSDFCLLDNVDSKITGLYITFTDIG